MKQIAGLSISLLLACTLAGCLKTRAQLRGDGDSSGGTPVEVQPQGGYVVDELKGEITRLTGRIEDLERKNAEGGVGSAAAAEELKKLETRIIELEAAQAAMLEAIQKLKANVPPPNPKELLTQARNQMEAGNHAGAIEALTEYLKVENAPDAQDALFMRGEAYMATQQYKKAIVDFSKFPEKYTRSKKMPAALLNIGLAFEALGMKDDAKGFYTELADKYPKSPEAKKAKAKLQ